MEVLDFRIGAIVEASAVAFGRAFADQAPVGAVYRGMVIGRDEDDDNGVAEGRRIWSVHYDDDDTVWPTAQEHLTPVRAEPEEIARARRLDSARAQPEPTPAKKRTTAAIPPPRRTAMARPTDLTRFRVGAGAASAVPRPAVRAPAAPDGAPGAAQPSRRPVWALGASDSSRPRASSSDDAVDAAGRRWAAVQAVARRVPSPAFDAPPAKKAYKRARRVDAGAGGPHQGRLFALLDLDGTLFHMLPEAEVPTNLDAICEGVVPLDAPVPGPAVAATPTRHVLCVRKGTRALLAALRACGATVHVVTANLMGVEAVAALAAHEAATEASAGDAIQGWCGALDVTVVVDRAPGSKRLPDDVAAALRAQQTARCVILDDNPTAWAAPAKPHVWVVPQFDVRRPLTSQELHAELRLLPSISERCRAFLAPPAQAPPATRRTAPASAPIPRSASELAPASAPRPPSQPIVSVARGLGAARGKRGRTRGRRRTPAPSETDDEKEEDDSREMTRGVVRRRSERRRTPTRRAAKVDDDDEEDWDSVPEEEEDDDDDNDWGRPARPAPRKRRRIKEEETEGDSEEEVLESGRV